MHYNMKIKIGYENVCLGKIGILKLAQNRKEFLFDKAHLFQNFSKDFLPRHPQYPAVLRDIPHPLDPDPQNKIKRIINLINPWFK